MKWISLCVLRVFFRFKLCVSCRAAAVEMNGDFSGCKELLQADG